MVCSSSGDKSAATFIIFYWMALATLVGPIPSQVGLRLYPHHVMDLALGSPGCSGSVAPWISSDSAQHHWQQHWQLVVDLCTFRYHSCSLFDYGLSSTSLMSSISDLVVSEHENFENE